MDWFERNFGLVLVAMYIRFVAALFITNWGAT